MEHASSRWAFAASLALLSTASAQSTWFVDVAAAPPGDGSAASPFASLAYAVAHPSVVTGDTLSIAPGLYVESVTLGAKGLRIVGAGPEVTVLRASRDGAVIETPFTAGPLVEIEALTLAGDPQFATSGAAGSALTLRRCVLRDHRGGGAGLFAQGSGVFSSYQARVERCTVVRNEYGLRNYVFNGDTFAFDSIVVGNAQEDVDDLVYLLWCSWNEPFWTWTGQGPGNLHIDPLFWDAALNDFALRPGSPCIDAGDPSAPLDADGTRRDMGAFPFDAIYAPGPDPYCTAKLNSLGCTPAINGSGLASATSAAPFVVQCVNERAHRSGLLFYGYAPRATPYQGGWLCVQSPSQRTPIQDAGGTPGVDDCSGVYSFDFNARIQSGVDSALVPGALVYAQFWSRDPGASFQTNRSDALRFGVAP